MTAAIRIQNVSKRYRLGETHAGSVRELANRCVNRLLGKAKPGPSARSANDGRVDEQGNFWALRDVCCDIPFGEAVGIIGKNGAGKSTLLKILSRITAPTSGLIELHGRVASLLEVGTGFHAELTGRENVYLNGSILGMKKAEIHRHFEGIVAFAGVERFIDSPVKRYSSGMVVRLGFAVAAHLEPEILIVDEVLAVGDLEFQERCLGKMNEVARSGRTVLFVSHNLASIRQLTKSCLFMSQGQVDFFGPTHEAIRKYVHGNTDQTARVYDLTNHERPFGGLTRDVEFTRLEMSPSADGHYLDDDRLQFTAHFLARADVESFRLGLTVFGDEGEAIGSSFSEEMGPIRADVPFQQTLIGENWRLAPGSYYCGVSIGNSASQQNWELLDSVSEVLHFRVAASGKANTGVQAWQPGWGPIRLTSLKHSPERVCT